MMWPTGRNEPGDGTGQPGGSGVHVAAASPSLYLNQATPYEAWPAGAPYPYHRGGAVPMLVRHPGFPEALAQRPPLQIGATVPQVAWGVHSLSPGAMDVGHAAFAQQESPQRGRGALSHRGRSRGGRSRGRRGSAEGANSNATGMQPFEEVVWLLRRLRPNQPVTDVVVDGLGKMDSRSVASLLKMLAKSNLLKRAWEIFDWLRSLPPDHELQRLCDVFTYTAMISLCTAPKELDMALKLSEEMSVLGIERNVHTYSVLMNVCIKCGSLPMALEVYSAMQKDSCAPNVVTYNTLIDVYGKTGQWAEAMSVLLKMRQEGIEPVTRTYNTLMIACNNSGQWQEALNVYEHLTESGLLPNTTTYNALISAHSRAGRLEKVMETFQKMVRQGCERTVITYSSLISACEKAGQWELALQLFNEMHLEGCVPNVITYNSFISACAQGAQWERASQVFDQMGRQGCTPDVVTYTALISAFERGGQWRRALDAFECMQRQGCTPDNIVYNAIIDALWDTGIVWAQGKAVLLYRRALSDGLLRKPLTSLLSTRSVELNLNTLTSGIAMLTLFCWLADLRDLVLREGIEALEPNLTIVTGRNKQRDYMGGPVIKDAILAVLQSNTAPFRSVMAAPSTGKLECRGEVLAEWLQGEVPQRLLQPFAATLEQAGSEHDFSEEIATEQRCQDAFAAVKHFETTHCLNVHAMGFLYLHTRAEVVAAVFRIGKELGLEAEAVHSGVLLLDRAMSTGMQLDNLLLLALATCALTCSKGKYNFQPSNENVTKVTGFMPINVRQMEATISNALKDDMAAVSALHCLKLYLERLGLVFMEEGAVVDTYKDAFSLVYLAVLDTEFLNYRPSITAAAILYCDRLQRGILPFWPSSLAVLTGYNSSSTPELAAAINGVQRLFKQLQSTQSSSNGLNPPLMV